MISKFKTLVFIFWILFNPVISFGQVPEYYSEIDFTKSSDEIKNQLHELISYNTVFPYTSYITDVWDILGITDKDPNNNDNIILIYSGESKEIGFRDGGSSPYMLEIYKEYDNGKGSRGDSWNREHVYPKSRFNRGNDIDFEYNFDVQKSINDERDIASDVHNLKPVKMRINSSRSNRVFGFKDEGFLGDYGITSTGAYYPGDQFIGDIARIIMYMHLRYENISPASNVGEGLIVKEMPEIFLLWNQLDPPDEFEKNRNEIIYGFQENRNPFIDNPYLATEIWGGPPTIDTWGVFKPYEIDIFPETSSTSIEVIREYYGDDLIKYQIFDMSGKEVSKGKTIQNVDISFLENGNYLLKLFIEDYVVSKNIKKI